MEKFEGVNVGLGLSPCFGTIFLMPIYMIDWVLHHINSIQPYKSDAHIHKMPLREVWMLIQDSIPLLGQIFQCPHS